MDQQYEKTSEALADADDTLSEAIEALEGLSSVTASLGESYKIKSRSLYSALQLVIRTQEDIAKETEKARRIVVAEWEKAKKRELAEERTGAKDKE